jgi:Nucleotidyltransferase domain
MTSAFHKYCVQLLDDYSVSEKDKKQFPKVFEAIWQELKPIHTYNPRRYLGGSYAKGTMIKGAFDLDIVIYFAKNSDKTPQLWVEMVENILKQQHSIQKLKRYGVAIQFQYKGYEVDLVVGKAQDEQFEMVDLWNKKEAKNMRASLKLHVENVSDVEPILRLMKIWRLHHQLNWHKLAMEQTVVRVLKNKPKNDFGECLKLIFLDIKTNINTVKFLDPANSNNPLFVSPQERKAIKGVAEQSWTELSKHNFVKIMK